MTTQPWRLLITEPASGPWNMAVDEAIMTCQARGVSTPTVRFYGWNPPCLSIGYFQAVERDIDLNRVSESGIHLVRRPTGGRAILHDDELTYSVIIPDSHPLAHGGVVESYRRISAGLVAGLSRMGLEVSADPATKRNDQTRSAACFDTTSHYELTVAGRKLVGSAQMRRGGVLLQHGSILLSLSVESFFSLLRLGSEAERTREAEGFARRVIGLNEALGRDVRREEVRASLKSGFEDALGISLHQEPLTDEEKTEAERIMADKYSSDDWNLRR